PELTNGQPTPGEYAATIDWGDSRPTSTGTITFAGGTFTVRGSHTYAEEGSYTISVLLQHGTSPDVPVTTTAIVSDPPVLPSGVNILRAVPLVFSTGVGRSCNPLPGGSNDPHWTVADVPTASSPKAAVVITNPPARGLVGNASSSAWVSVNSGGGSGSTDTFDYQTTFDVTDPATARLTFNVASDDDITAILLNGVNTGLDASAATFTGFTTFPLTSGVVAGANALDFLA